MRIISKETAKKIIDNYNILGGLIAIFGKHQATIERWIETRDIRLTIPASLEIIRKETGLTNEQILETEK